MPLNKLFMPSGRLFDPPQEDITCYKVCSSHRCEENRFWKLAPNFRTRFEGCSKGISFQIPAKPGKINQFFARKLRKIIEHATNLIK